MGIGQWLALSKFTVLDFGAPINAQSKWLIILATIAIGFAGYIINDYYDQEIDKINRPKRNLFEKGLFKKGGIVVYILLNLFGLFLGLFLSYKLLILNAVCVVLLFLYSKYFKGLAVVGNLVAALLQALVFMPCLFYLDFSSAVFPGIHLSTSSFLMAFLVLIMLFAFLTAWFREWVKDIEDKEGDAASSLKTAPLVFSPNFNRTALLIISVLLAFLVVGFTIALTLDDFYKGDSVLVYFYAFLIVPLSVRAIVMLKNAQEKADWSKLSSWLKMLMLAGVLSIGIL